MKIPIKKQKVIKSAFEEAERKLKKVGFKCKFSLLFSPRFNLTSDEKYHLRFMPAWDTNKKRQIKGMVEIWTQFGVTGGPFTTYNSVNLSE